MIANAERLPFPDRSFDCVTIGFGLRNVTDKPAALAVDAARAAPGGRLLVLEFSKPTLEVLRPAYDAYSFNVLPRLGGIVAGDAASYRYLAESIRMHPDQETLAGDDARGRLRRLPAGTTSRAASSRCTSASCTDAA